MARRSARISSRNSCTPQPTKRVSLSDDAFAHAPRTVPAKLASLQESDEMPGSFPLSPSVSMFEQPSKRQRTSISTPTRSSNIVPAKEEMHPQAAHQTTVKANEEARWLGFSAMPLHANAAANEARTPMGVATPSKSKSGKAMVQSPPFQFTFHREQSLELSPAAKSLMQEKRAEAARIKEQMRSSGQTSESSADALSRKIATPKSQRSRFSDVHSAQFSKMDSIAGHASAYRKDPLRLQTIASPSKAAPASPSNTLKRSPSKTTLAVSTPSKIAQAITTTGTKRKAEVQLTKATAEQSESEPASPRKRVKCVESTTSTPVKTGQHNSVAVKVEHIMTPTKASLARASSVKSVKSSKIPAPAMLNSPTKTASIPVQPSEKHNTTLFSKMPIKAAIGLEAPSMIATPAKNPFLARSPLRPAPSAAVQSDTASAQPGQELLNRPPSKVIFGAGQSDDNAVPVTRTPLLSKTPSRATGDINPFHTELPLENSKSVSSNLLGHFNLLRATPVKSILRSPQRLYSDDPAKVAAGTHLATPPQVKGRFGRMIPATAPVRKHVDFSSSTKAREASKETSLSPSIFSPRQQKVAAPVTAAAITYPSLEELNEDESLSVQKRRQSSGPSDFTFRAGSEIVFAPSSTPTKACITPRAASAYTIRYVAPEPEMPAVASNINPMKQRKIRFENAVSAAQTNASPTTTLGSKKRKFDFENDVAEKDASLADMLDKENAPADDIQNDRPAKRFKPSASPAVPQKARSVSEVKKRTTLGVKPKSAIGRPPEKSQKKSTSTISMARLAALAQPKKRG